MSATSKKKKACDQRRLKYWRWQALQDHQQIQGGKVNLFSADTEWNCSVSLV